MKRGCVFVYLVLLIHFSTFSALASTCVASDQDERTREKVSVKQVVAGEMTSGNPAWRPLDRPPEKTSGSQKDFPSPKDKSPIIKTEDALEGAGDEEDTLVEEGLVEESQHILDTALESYQTAQELWSRGELEEAIAALDEAYSFILQVNGEGDPAITQAKEDLRILISRRLIEIYASRYSTVNGSHKAIPLTLNEHVEYEVKQFQTVERNFFVNAYRQSGRYMDRIVKALNEAGLPEELAWLPLVESGFNVRALSPARALGLWQFIPSTGYKFGLKRDDWIDERLDPEKSTKAAIAYLQELHLMFGDWTTVLAAYNSGEGNVLKVIRGQQVNYLDNFWDLYQRLPRETARYVPRFLATLHIVKEPGKYGFDLGEREEPLSCEVVTTEKQVRLDAISKEVGVLEALLSDLNPELRVKVTPPTAYPLRVPPAMSEMLLARLDSIPEWSRVRTGLAKGGTQGSSKFSYVIHRVSEGECLSSIAEKYKTTVTAISKANHIGNTQFIKTGQKLKIPLSRGKVRALK
jgi:membrane-bound lytic murein transglycosylase D